MNRAKAEALTRHEPFEERPFADVTNRSDNITVPRVMM